ncbi:ExbD/TolR family protein [Aquimarina rhabdastrellae]
MRTNKAPEINAGSMADIAFLLLIFFLVTTTLEADSGISRKLPPLLDETPNITIKDKNIFVVDINKNDELLVEEQPMLFEDLKAAAVAFLDNGGGQGEETCAYCQGEGLIQSSDNPQKAIISLRNDRETSYEMYIAVQNELMAAYTTLRNREAMRLYKLTFEEMERKLKDVNDMDDKIKLKEHIKKIKALFPEKLSEAETRK